MKRSLIAAFLISPAVLSAQEEQAAPETAPTTSSQAHAPHAWLGLRVAKPDATINAQVPALPPGIGFLVKSLDQGGPAASAGLQELDLIWKLGDQMLVNESQLAALLRLSKPGEEITLGAFRGGKPLEVKLKLGEAPLLKKPFPHEMVEASILTTDCTVPMRVVNVAEKTAAYSTDDGKAVVQLDGDRYKVSIHDPADKLIFEGNFAQDDKFEKVPDDWRKRVFALRRGLDQSLDGRMMPARQPRPRVVPPVVATP
jgi:hypothetical protein